MGSRWCRRGSGRSDLHEFYIEDYRRVGRNNDLSVSVLHILSSVAERRRDGEEAFAPFFHAVDPYLEARNKALRAEDEDQWLISGKIRTEVLHLANKLGSSFI